MMKKITILTMMSIVVLMTNSVCAQWTAVNNGLPATTTKGVARVNGKLYTAVNGHGIYVSSNNGDSWSKWSRSGELPNTNFISFVGNEFDMEGNASVFFTVTGENLVAVFEDQEGNQNSLSILPTNGLTGASTQINAFGGTDAGNTRFYATNGGLYSGDKSLQATFKKVEGISETKINAMQGAGQNNEFLFLGTDKGIFRSSDDGKTFSAYNLGFEKILRINRMSGLFQLTERGAYLYSSSIGSFRELTNAGENRVQNIGDYKSYVYHNGKVYFFGKNVGTELDFFVTFEMKSLPLNGITDTNTISGTTVVGDYLFVSTDNGGVFRTALGDLGISNFSQLPKAQFTVMPNPSSGDFKIVSEKAATIQLLDITGKLIKTYSVDKAIQIKENLTPGLYFLKDATNGGAKKLIIK